MKIRDWRDPEQYKFPKSFPRYRWAWNFLRRNPDYQAEWEAVLGRFQRREAEFVRPRDFHFGGTSELQIMVRDDQAAADIRAPGFRIPHDDCREHWGISDYLNPQTDRPLQLRFVEGAGSVQFGTPADSKKALGRWGAWVGLDLSRPIKPQLRLANKNIRDALEMLRFDPEFRIRQPKPHVDLWPSYLRLLDAYADGVSPQDFAREFPFDSAKPGAVLDEGKVRRRFEAAQRLTQPANYLSILF